MVPSMSGTDVRKWRPSFRKIREGRQPLTLDGWGLPLSSEGCQRNAENTVAAMHAPMTAPATTCASV